MDSVWLDLRDRHLAFVAPECWEALQVERQAIALLSGVFMMMVVVA
jgi:hypothetical protein